MSGILTSDRQRQLRRAGRLKQVGFSLAEEKSSALIGPNGAGKTRCQLPQRFHPADVRRHLFRGRSGHTSGAAPDHGARHARTFQTSRVSKRMT